MDEIRAHYSVNDKLSSSGQPTHEQFADIAKAGFDIVINIAMPDSTHAIRDEGAVVTALGMTYIHIPVSWEQPRFDDVEKFFAAMRAYADKKVWLHCALNMRASCFTYLYQKHVLQLPEQQARFPMREIWQPDGAWAELIAIADREYA